MKDKKIDEFATITEIIYDLKSRMDHFEVSLTKLIDQAQQLFDALESENKRLKIENERLKNAMGS